MWIFRGIKNSVAKALGAAVQGRPTSAHGQGKPRESSPLRIPTLFLIAFFVVLTCLIVPRMGRSSSEFLYQIQEVKPDVFVSVPEDVINQDCDPFFNRAGVAGFILTSEGVVVVDTSNSPMNARDLLYEIRRRTESPIRYVINTSSSPDHMLGNEVFYDEQATIISTRAAQEGMQQYQQDLLGRFHDEEGWRLQARMRGFHVTPSTQTFEGQMSLKIGGQEFRVTSIPAGGASPEDAIVYLPAEKVLFLGELFENHYFPRVGQRDVRQWIDALKRLESWDVDIFVPGHGVPGGKKDLVDFRKFLEWTVAQVEMRLKQGKSPAAIQKELLIQKTYNWHAPERALGFVADICRQLAPPPKPQPPAPASPEPGPATPQAQ